METRDGQQSGVVAKNWVNVAPCSVSNLFTAGICATEAESRSSITIVTKFGRLCAMPGEIHDWVAVANAKPGRTSRIVSNRTITRRCSSRCGLTCNSGHGKAHPAVSGSIKHTLYGKTFAASPILALTVTAWNTISNADLFPDAGVSPHLKRRGSRHRCRLPLRSIVRVYGARGGSGVSSKD